MITIRSGAFRLSNCRDLKWDQVHFSDGKLYVSRKKNGDPSVPYLEGDEILMLRKLQRDYPDSPFLFVSQKGGPLSSRTVRDIVARAGEFAGIDFPVHPHMLRHAKRDLGQIDCGPIIFVMYLPNQSFSSKSCITLYGG